MKLTLKAGAGSTKISFFDAIKFLGIDAIVTGERRGEVKSYGHWLIPTAYKALAVTATWHDIGITYNVVNEYTLHGDRTITNPKSSGYCLGGWVSIDGKKRSCFTSTILFELPDKTLIDVAVIHVRTKDYLR